MNTQEAKKIAKQEGWKVTFCDQNKCEIKHSEKPISLTVHSDKVGGGILVKDPTGNYSKTKATASVLLMVLNSYRKKAKLILKRLPNKKSVSTKAASKTKTTVSKESKVKKTITKPKKVVVKKPKSTKKSKKAK